MPRTRSSEAALGKARHVGPVSSFVLQLVQPNWNNLKPSHHNQLPSSAWFEHVFSSTLHPTPTLYRS
ncbi:Phenylalanine--tRNA ligase alpha subunit [Fusarium oxysporum f. sp. albedinis]|nr:Phenylalanine--tRNA ligase alpha subunit [Fusarium oxysporum f. sp. albedinis]